MADTPRLRHPGRGFRGSPFLRREILLWHGACISIGRNKTAPEYEKTHQEALWAYNALLLEAKARLQAAIARVERTEAAAQEVGELAGKIRELIEYLEGAVMQA